MNSVLIALALQVQQPQPPRVDARPPLREPALGHWMHESERASPAEARIAMHRFGACVADRRTAAAADALVRDFRTSDYRARLRALAEDNSTCMAVSGRMRSGSLLFAAAIAERLIEQDPEPLNVRLARAAMRPAPTAFAPSDAVAICVVRSVPDNVARLFASEPASPEEEAATTALKPATDLCAGRSLQLDASDGGLRGILATAAFRTLRAAAPTDPARN